MNHLGVGGLGTHGEGAPELCNALGGDAGLGILVLLKLHNVLLDLHGHGNDLIVKPAGGLGGLSLLLGGGGKLVLLLAGDAPDVVDVLGSGAHVVVVVGIPQAVLDHLVHQLLVAHAGAPAGVGSQEGSGAHVLGAAADHNVGVAGQDGAGALDDRLHTGAADHAHGVGRNRVGDAGLDGDLAGHVLPKTRGQNAAEHQLVHLLRLHAGAVQSLFDHDSAHLGGGGVLQAAAERADSGSAAADDIKIFHDVPPFYKNFLGGPGPPWSTKSGGGKAPC